MPAAAQGVNKTTSYKKQTGLGTAAAGSGGQKIRRRTFVLSKPIDTYESDEMVSHQQSTGVGIGPAKPGGKLEGLLSPGTYKDLLQSLLRRDFTAITAIAGASLTIAGAGPTYTITRGAGSWLTDGIKAGHVIRLSVGTFNAANLLKNIIVIAVTSATVLTVMPLNQVALVAEGPVATSTVTVIGKTTFVPITGHTNDYYTFEDWYSDISRSETLVDAKIAKADIGVPASGNATISIDIPGLTRKPTGAQVLTTPAAETTTDFLQACFGLLVCNGAVIGNVTGIQVSIDGKIAHGDPVVGSNSSDDHNRGNVSVSGSFTAKFDSVTLQTIFDAGNTTSLVVCVSEDATGTADFVVITIPLLKLTGDQPDDGMKQVVRSYPFVAGYNALGGAGTSTDQSIITIQDSAA